MKDKLISGMNSRVFLLSFLLLCSCRDEPDPMGKCFNWEDYTTPCSPFGKTMVPVYPYLDAPSFSPTSSSQFIYISNSDGIADYKLIKANLDNVDAQEIYAFPSLASIPDWGMNGWIVYGTNGQIFKISESGGQPIQVTVQPQNFFPTWSKTGDRLLYKNRAGNQSPYLAILADADGASIDTFSDNNAPLGYSFSRSCAISPGGFAVVPLAYRQFQILDELPFDRTAEFNFPFLEEFDKINDLSEVGSTGDIVWCCDRGIYRTNPATGITTKIKEACDAIQYQNLSVSPDGKKIITAVIVYEEIDPCTFYQYGQIRLMNIDGSDEEILELE